jgi:hypothetical protein
MADYSKSALPTRLGATAEANKAPGTCRYTPTGYIYIYIYTHIYYIYTCEGKAADRENSGLWRTRADAGGRRATPDRQARRLLTAVAVCSGMLTA